MKSTVWYNDNMKRNINKIVVIASSTGGPKALQRVLPLLPADIGVPIVVVQHILSGFADTLAQRLNEASEITIKGAVENEALQRGCAYFAQGGKHMHYRRNEGLGTVYFTNDPPRNGVRPCANYFYESLVDSPFDEIVCVVMTGMGMDATEGILHLEKHKKIHVIAQNEETCTVYGMPRSIIEAGKADKIVRLDDIAREIILSVGEEKNGR